MPKLKYTREQQKQCYELYHTDREPQGVTGKRTVGKYSLKEIEQMTGVPLHSAWQIANGRR